MDFQFFSGHTDFTSFMNLGQARKAGVDPEKSTNLT